MYKATDMADQVLHLKIMSPLAFTLSFNSWFFSYLSNSFFYLSFVDSSSIVYYLTHSHGSSLQINVMTHKFVPVIPNSLQKHISNSFLVYTQVGKSKLLSCQ